MSVPEKLWIAVRLLAGVWLVLCVAACVLFMAQVAWCETRARWRRRRRRGGGLTDDLIRQIGGAR